MLRRELAITGRRKQRSRAVLPWGAGSYHLLAVFEAFLPGARREDRLCNPQRPQVRLEVRPSRQGTKYLPWNLRERPVGHTARWTAGLLTPQSSVFPPGQQRDHFLALATPRNVDEMRKKDGAFFKPSAYGSTSATLMNYNPSSAWTWMVHGKTHPRVILYNDI